MIPAAEKMIETDTPAATGAATRRASVSMATLTPSVAQRNTWHRLAKPFARQAGVFQAG